MHLLRTRDLRINTKTTDCKSDSVKRVFWGRMRRARFITDFCATGRAQRVHLRLNIQLPVCLHLYRGWLPAPSLDSTHWAGAWDFGCATHCCPPPVSPAYPHTHTHTHLAPSTHRTHCTAHTHCPFCCLSLTACCGFPAAATHGRTMNTLTAGCTKHCTAFSAGRITRAAYGCDCRCRGTTPYAATRRGHG